MISEQCPSWRRYLDIYNEYAQNGKTIDELKKQFNLIKRDVDTAINKIDNLIQRKWTYSDIDQLFSMISCIADDKDVLRIGGLVVKHFESFHRFYYFTGDIFKINGIGKKYAEILYKIIP